MSQNLFISSSPHISDKDSVPKIMFQVIAALVPAGIFSVYTFGIHALWVILVASVAALIAEWACQKIMNRPVTITDGSALLTGILVAYNVPAEVPLWLPALGSIFGIVVGKQLFGGLGYNPMNPALLGRAFLMASWPLHMTVFGTVPKNGTLSGIDVMTSATPLAVFKNVRETLINTGMHTPDEVSEATIAMQKLTGSYDNLLFGNIGGCLGETSAILLILGGIYLMWKHIIGWKIPVVYIGTVALFTWIFGGTSGLFSGHPVFHILSGGLMLGAFFMATDMVSTPVTFKGRLIFGIGCGILTVVIRLWGDYPEGVSYSILLMNLTTPLLDRTTTPKKFGSSSA